MMGQEILRRLTGLFLAVALAASPVVAVAEDWTGTYGGVGLASASGTHSEYEAGSLEYSYTLGGKPREVLLGYARQIGRLVVGPEISYSNSTVAITEEGPEENYNDRRFDIKARIGYPSGKALFYVTAGKSFGDIYYAGVDQSYEPLKASGISYGIGADYMISKNWFFGAEVLKKSLKLGVGDIPGYELWSANWEMKSVTLRLGMRF
jgi:opacity protein-like surface antigen